MSSNEQESASLGDRLQLSIRSEPLHNAAVDMESYVALFHDWIRQSALTGLLIDVASYAHVPNGPGVLLIGHELDYSVRIVCGRVELTCRHKRDPAAEGDALQRCLRQLLRAAHLLESATTLSEAPSFRASWFVFRSNDRLLCPNERDARARVTRTVGSLFCRALGIDNLDVASIGAEREALTLSIKRPPRLGSPEDMAMTLRRLHAA